MVAKFEEWWEKHKSTRTILIAVIGIVIGGIILKFLFPSSPISAYLFGTQPNLEGYADCKLITSSIVKNENFLVNNSSDYYADIYTLRNSDPLTNAVMEIDLPLPDDIKPAGFQSIPDTKREINVVENMNVETMQITTRWNNIPPKTNLRVLSSPLNKTVVNCSY